MELAAWNLHVKVGNQCVVASGSSHVALPIVLLDGNAFAKSESSPPDPIFPV